MSKNKSSKGKKNLDPYASFNENKSDQLHTQVKKEMKEIQTEKNNNNNQIIEPTKVLKTKIQSANKFDMLDKKNKTKVDDKSKKTNIKQSKYFISQNEPDFSEEAMKKNKSKDPFYQSTEDAEEEALNKSKEKIAKAKQAEQAQKQQMNLQKSQQKQDKKQDAEKKTKNKKKQQSDGTGWSKDSIYILLFIGIFVLGTGYLKYVEQNYAKNRKFNQEKKEGFTEDLYEVLQIDSSATTADIKKKGKAQALIWHPDKNPNCGKECDDKFRKTMRAYEILSVEETRRSYDKTSGGVVTPIKSKAISLTPSNYDRLIDDSKDIWIVQIYEDGDDWCESFSGVWEQMTQEYGGSAKFGRIEQTKYMALIRQKLPINIVVIPTVLALIPNQDFEIFSPGENSRFAFKKFIESSLDNEVKTLNNEELESYLETENKPFDKNKAIEMMYLSQSSKAPFIIQYYQYKFGNQIDLYFNQYSGIIKLQQYQAKYGSQKTKPNALIAYNNYANNSRHLIQIQFDNKMAHKNQLSKLMQFVKFTQLPTINKNNFQDYCEGLNLRGEDGNEEDLTKQPICVLFQVKNEQQKENIQETLKQYISEIQNQIIPKLSQVVSDKTGQFAMFDHFSQIQFGFIDIPFHQPFNKIVEQVLQKKMKKDEEEVAIKVDEILALAILPVNQKMVILTQDKVSDVENWLDLVIDESPSLDYQYLNELLDDTDMRMFLYIENFNLFYASIKEFFSNIINYQLILSLSAIIGAIFYFNEYIDKNQVLIIGGVVYVLAVSALTYLSVYSKYLDF